MEIKILNHPNDNSVSPRGIESNETKKSAKSGDSKTPSKETKSQAVSASKNKEASLLASSFVHLDTKPGY